MLPFMKSALDTCTTASTAVAGVNVGALSAEQYRTFAAGIQHHLDRITVLHARILQHGQDHGLFTGTGAKSMADWLAQHSGTSHGETASKMKLANSMEKSPELSDAVDNGDISPSTANAISDAVSNAPEGADVNDLLDAVKGADPKTAKAVAERWKEENSTESDEQREARLHKQRSLRFADPVDGMITGTFRLPTLAGREVMTAISHLAGKPSQEDGRTTEQRLADGLVQLCDAYAKGTLAGGRERPTIIITAPIDTLLGLSQQPGHTMLGDLVPAHVVRRLAEQAELQTVITAGNDILALTTTQRLATDNQWRALMVRDGGCRWPGCNIPANWCDADHIIPWEHGGKTVLENLALLCRHHHRVKHGPGTEAIGDASTLRMQLPDGTVVNCPPRPLPQRHSRTASAAA
ncbi:MAG: DUF222 domain-containing protein [Actinobacteria bacterium]|nr:DUF222 domain-containing protein [Actinomycetota bacterium]